MITRHPAPRITGRDRSAAIIACALLGACDARQGEPLPPTLHERPSVERESGPAMPPTHPDVEALRILSRGPRRMSVEQLERSIEQIGELPRGTVALPDSLALALGRPDDLRVTEESLEPSPLFMKFMTDLAGYVCTALSDADPGRPEHQRVLTRFGDRDTNIAYLLLRFTGIEGAAAEGYAERLRTVYDGGSKGARGERAGWEAVCIALFTSPEFLLY